MSRRRLHILCLTLAAFAVGGPAIAGEARVAVAGNFSEPAKEIARAFEAKTGHETTLSFGASGQFYAQIAHGAPFEVFLSADSERPARAEQEGLGVRGSRFTYAVGRLVLFSTTPGLVDQGGAVLRTGRFEKLAIADPSTAPYGAAAVATMNRLGVYGGLRGRIVTGSSITQAYQFVDSGAAQLGFVAWSQVIQRRDGSRWLVPPSFHPPMEQQAILLRSGEKNAAARAFLDFLKGPTATAIIRRYGYAVPRRG
jgi:molybdate transport system substrate-binding protein